MTSTADPDLKRILVTLDASARGRAALEAAVRLATNLSAEIQGLFVEDEDLIRLASLPFASEVDLLSAASRELQTVTMERALRSAAEETQQVFAEALQQRNLQWTFRVVRGTVTQVSLAAAGDVDLLVIGQQGHSPLLATNYLLKRAAVGPITAVFDGSAPAYRTMTLASSLAESTGRPLCLLALGGEEVSDKCTKWLQQRGVGAEIDEITNPTDHSIADFIRKWPPSVLLVNRNSTYGTDAQVRRLVDELDCPLVLC